MVNHYLFFLHFAMRMCARVCLFTLACVWDCLCLFTHIYINNMQHRKLWCTFISSLYFSPCGINEWKRTGKLHAQAKSRHPRSQRLSDVDRGRCERTQLALVHCLPETLVRKPWPRFVVEIQMSKAVNIRTQVRKKYIHSHFGGYLGFR